MTIQDKLKNIKTKLNSTLLERDQEIEILMTALLCQEHVLFIGNPGLAKTLLLEELMHVLEGNVFTALLTKHTEPAEVFGPFDMNELRKGNYVRITKNKLPEATGVYLDEIWKSSSAFLNCLLRVLNERVFDRGNGVLEKVPLRICVASSNEWPNADNGGKELKAMEDRFLFRRTVKPIGKASNKEKLLWAPNEDFTSKWTKEEKLSNLELDTALLNTRKIEPSDKTKEVFWKIDSELRKEGIVPSDRRLRKSIQAAKAHAFLEGNEAIEPTDLLILEHVLWDEPIEQPAKAREIIYKHADPIGNSINKILFDVEEIMANTDMTNISLAMSAIGKLKDCKKQLDEIKKDPRQKEASIYVQECIVKANTCAIKGF